MTEPSEASDNLPYEEDDEISLFDLLIVLAKHKMLILGLPFVVSMVAAAYSLTLPNIYTGTTKILVPQQATPGAAAALLGQLGSIGGLLGGSFGKGAGDVYVAMLQSRTLADSLVESFNLLKPGEAKSSARDKLAAITNVAVGKEGIITIETDDEDPKRAAALANAYVDGLLKLTQELAVTEASKRRLFFERQLTRSKDNLAKAEADARQALERGGLAKVEEQGRSTIENAARLRAQITVKEVQIGAMRTFAADHNPDLRLAQQELESMRRELEKMEGVGGARLSTIRSNGQGAESLRLLRNVKYHEVIFELLAKQYELAKIDEAKDSAVVQVMDKAVDPERRSKPRRTRIVLISALIAGFVAVLFAFVREGVERSSNNPQQAARMSRLRSYLRLTRANMTEN